MGAATASHVYAVVVDARIRGMHSLSCQTSTATPVEPGASHRRLGRLTDCASSS